MPTILDTARALARAATEECDRALTRSPDSEVTTRFRRVVIGEIPPGGIPDGDTIPDGIGIDDTTPTVVSSARDPSELGRALARTRSDLRTTADERDAVALWCAGDRVGARKILRRVERERHPRYSPRAAQALAFLEEES